MANNGEKKKRRGRPKGGISSEASRQKLDSIRLADLFLWIDIVDACQEHPNGGLMRAAADAGIANPENINHVIDRLEEQVGKTLFDYENVRDPNVRNRIRDGRISSDGAFLAEVSVVIEHLWQYLMTPRKKSAVYGEVMTILEVKKEIFRILSQPIGRDLERDVYRHNLNNEIRKQNRIGRVIFWQRSILKQRLLEGKVRICELPRLLVRDPPRTKAPAATGAIRFRRKQIPNSSSHRPSIILRATAEEKQILARRKKLPPDIVAIDEEIEPVNKYVPPVGKSAVGRTYWQPLLPTVPAEKKRPKR